MRFVFIIIGVLLAFAGVACAASGVATVRTIDDDGFVSSGPAQLSTPARAITGDTAELVNSGDRARDGKVKVRINADPLGGRALFLGIGPSGNVDALLRRAPYVVLSDIEFDPLEFNARDVPGTGTAGPPEAATFWVASTSGEGPLELVWPFTDGEDGEARYSFVIMAADGSEGVDATVTLATRFPYLRGYAIAAIVVGGVLVVLGVLLVAIPILIGRRRRRREAPPGLEPAT